MALVLRLTSFVFSNEFSGPLWIGIMKNLPFWVSKQTKLKRQSVSKAVLLSFHSQKDPGIIFKKIQNDLQERFFQSNINSLV